MNAEKTGILIYDLRTRKGLTQKELAEKCNVSDKAVSKWERGCLNWPRFLELKWIR